MPRYFLKRVWKKAFGKEKKNSMKCSMLTELISLDALSLLVDICIDKQFIVELVLHVHCNNVCVV